MQNLTDEQQSSVSLYEKIGGESTLNYFVTKFYKEVLDEKQQLGLIFHPTSDFIKKTHEKRFNEFLNLNSNSKPKLSTIERKKAQQEKQLKNLKSLKKMGYKNDN